VLSVAKGPEDGQAIPFSSWAEAANEIHDRQKAIFEESITDKLRGLLQ